MRHWQRRWLVPTSCSVIALLLAIGILAEAVPVSSDAPNLGIYNDFKTYPGFPGASVVASTGNAMVSSIERSAQFKSLAKGVAYHIDPYMSFGYTWGSGISSTERVILFSPDESSYIVAEVDVATHHIQTMYLVNSAETGIRMENPANENYGGYSAQLCTGSLFGLCYSTGSINDAYGKVTVPTKITAPSSKDETSACCMFGEWTGTVNIANGTLVQGGVLWAGFKQPKLAGANKYGFVLFIELVPNNTDYGMGAIFLSPPPWMGEVKGDTILMATSVAANCPEGDLWFQYWHTGLDYTSQSVACLPPGIENQGLFIFESPEAPSRCGKGGFEDFCQIPVFSSLALTGNICNLQGTCYRLNSNANPIQRDYIVHISVDTATSIVPSGGNSWKESWKSSR